MAKIIFATVYPYYVKKVVNKGRTEEELLQVIKWLTGYSEKKLKRLMEKKVNLETFFSKAKINKKANLITGVICGYRVEELKNPITKNARYLDKLIDELAKGKVMEKILRK
jgi:hypothetical protein